MLLKYDFLDKILIFLKLNSELEIKKIVNLYFCFLGYVPLGKDVDSDASILHKCLRYFIKCV